MYQCSGHGRKAPSKLSCLTHRELSALSEFNQSLLPCLNCLDEANLVLLRNIQCACVPVHHTCATHRTVHSVVESLQIKPSQHMTWVLQKLSCNTCLYTCIVHELAMKPSNSIRRQYRNAAQATRVSSAWGTASDCDLLLFIVDIHRQVTRLTAVFFCI